MKPQQIKNSKGQILSRGEGSSILGDTCAATFEKITVFISGINVHSTCLIMTTKLIKKLNGQIVN